MSHSQVSTVSLVKNKVLISSRLHLEAGGVPFPGGAGAAVCVRHHAQLLHVPGPGGGLHHHPSHLRLPTLLLHETRRLVPAKPSLETKVNVILYIWESNNTEWHYCINF